LARSDSDGKEPADILREMASRMWRRIRETDDFNMVHSHYGMFRYAPVGPGEW
jgi:hypothetical protein